MTTAAPVSGSNLDLFEDEAAETHHQSSFFTFLRK